MKNVRLEHRQLPYTLIQGLADRDAALWIGTDLDESEEGVRLLTSLARLPWKVILCESNKPELINAIEAAGNSGSTVERKRGFIHIVASDPEGVELPPRSLPLFLLNGRQQARQPGESPNLGIFGSLRRRLNMLNELVLARPKILVILAGGGEQPLKDFFELWKEGFRVLVILLSDVSSVADTVDTWLRETTAAPAVDHFAAPLSETVSNILARLHVEIPESRAIIRVKSHSGELAELDITECELVERPILEEYDLIYAKDLRLLQPDDLSLKDFESFFNRSCVNWTPYAAGLPWQRQATSKRQLIEALRSVEKNGSSENCILSIISESGAGGTTYAKLLAFQAAVDGYPTLLARPALAHPIALELSRFLYRVHVKAAENNLTVPVSTTSASEPVEHFEVPWLLVFDVSHWEGRFSELRSFLNSFTNDGRSVVILIVQSTLAPVDINRSWRTRYIGKLKHELELSEATELGDHLNKFLRPLGKPRSANQWRQFWQAHRPDYITSSIAHFWIALEFWLKGQIDINQSIQSWLFQSFKDAEMTDDLRMVILEIAAMTIERQPLPEGLIPLSQNHQYPYSVLLEDVKISVPALALIREASGGQKLWAMAHDLLGRYLITSVFFDRALLERLGLAAATDPVELRLALLRRVATREVLALRPYRELAVDFAIKILKLDAQGNQEFIPYWRDVLDILSQMPAGIRETSRAFNHHVAISLRRVVRQKEFSIPEAERKTLLVQAVGHLEYALQELDRDFEDSEPDLNLYNSLALAYQDLADVVRDAGGTPQEVESFRVKATEATLKALQEDPTNSYVLETTAKNLIQNGELHSENAAASASEALGYIYQAVTFERSEYRQGELTRLANRALHLLRKSNDQGQVQKLAKSGNPLGALAEAWMLLLEGIDDINEYDLSAMNPRNVANALAVLEEAPGKSNWMILRFRYDLITASRSSDFAAQLRLLDELEGTGFRMPLQVRLEQAILLHQEGRHMEGNLKFRQLRQDMRLADSILEVPKRLSWLRYSIDGGRRICEAQVLDFSGQRAMARVRELQNEPIPFVPHEFGVATMRPGLKFKCWITFGWKGPFIKPPEIGGAKDRS